MNKDIMGNVPRINDTIIRAKYERDSSLHVCKVIGENKSGAPKILRYWRTEDGTFQAANGYGAEGYAPGDFLIVQGLQL